MVRIRRLALLPILVWLAYSSDGENLVCHSLRRVPADSLFAQSAGQAFMREFGPCGRSGAAADGHCLERKDLSFLLLDADTGAILASRWEDPEKPIPLGSLIKPFTALAYGEHHEYQYPDYTCRGTSTGCWLPRGHGRIDLPVAIANSCNSYFQMLTADMTAEDVLPVANRFGLEPPRPGSSAADLRGLGTGWLISPLHMANAYLELTHRPTEPGIRQVLLGMAESARRGTGAEVDRALKHTRALAKTGTAPCTHRTAPGDGFVIAMMPADRPQILLMVRLHGAPGAQAAKMAGQMLQSIEQ